MACYNMIPAYQGEPGGPVRLLPPLGTANLEVRCGRCIGCRADRAHEWGERCYHEAQCYEHNIFATLTYDEDHVPWSLRPDHVWRWMKRLRKRVRARDSALVTTPPVGVRFFLSGEYGEQSGRPHYHAILFNVCCADKKKLAGDLWTSDELTSTWKLGEVVCGDVTAASAAYTAGYAIKKVGESGCEVSPDGEVRVAPFMRCSRRPGIGLPWLRTYAADLVHGYVVTRDGQKMPIPRYYRKKLEGSWLLEEADSAVQSRQVNVVERRLRRPDAEKIHARLLELKGARL